MESEEKLPTTYAEIRQRVEKNIQEGYGVPAEWLKLMADSLAAQQQAIEEAYVSYFGYRETIHKAVGVEGGLAAVKRIAVLRKAEERLQDAQARLPAETELEERQRLRKQKAQEAALQVCEYLIEHKTDLMGRLDFSTAPVEELFGYFGFSYAEYEGA